MKLYMHNTTGADKADSQALLAKAACDFAGEAWCAQHAIERNCHGKPYFIPAHGADESEAVPVHFSISHTKGVWCCVFGPDNVGLDVERRDRQVGWEQVTRRFFLPEEQEFVKANGESGFFRLWVRKEAWLKHRGTGLAGGLGSVCLVRDGQLCETVDEITFYDVDFSLPEEDCLAEITGAVCASGRLAEMETIWI